VSKLFIVFVVTFLGFQPWTSASDDERVRSDLEESITARLFVVPMRIETTSNAKRGYCDAIGPERLTVGIRGKILGSKEYSRQIKDGLVTLDRKTRPALHALVFDTSGSMGMDLQEAKSAALAYLDTTLGDLDKSMVVGFDDGVTLWQRATSDRVKLRDAIDRVQIAGQTSLFDALVHTIRELDSYRERPVIVVVSDGSDNASFYDVNDVIAELKRRPDLVVFAIGIGKRSADVRGMLRRVATTTFGQYFDVDSGGELAAVFDEIRDVLGTEVVLTVVDPDPTATTGKIEVRSFDSDCSVTVLGNVTEVSEKKAAREPIPFPPPTLPVSYDRPLSEAHHKILLRAKRLRDSSECYDGGRLVDSRLTHWKFDVGPWKVSGCAPDIMLSHGYLYDPGAQPFVSRNEEIQVKVRPFSIEIPRFVDLPDDPVMLLDALLAALPEEFSPSDDATLNRESVGMRLSSVPAVLQGTTFLEMRPSIARAFMSQPGYGEWAMARLEGWIESDVRMLEERYRKQFPTYSAEAVRLAADNSDDAKAMRARMEAPAEIDLQPFLAAWLGDLESVALFDAWERRAIGRSLEGAAPGDGYDEFVGGWRRLWDFLSLPSNVRVLAPLIPMYEAECDCVGFYRIVLPRPSLMRERMREHSVFLQGPRLDVAPKLPFGYALVQAVQLQIPEAGARLSAAGYRISSIDYELLGPPESHDPVRAFRETRVTLKFVAHSETEKVERRELTLTADLHRTTPPVQTTDRPAAPPSARRPRWLLDKVSAKVERDPELRKLFGTLDESLAGYELIQGPARP
jgi:Mg-chelatase subunit ChlD